MHSSRHGTCSRFLVVAVAFSLARRSSLYFSLSQRLKKKGGGRTRSTQQDFCPGARTPPAARTATGISFLSTNSAPALLHEQYSEGLLIPRLAHNAAHHFPAVASTICMAGHACLRRAQRARRGRSMQFANDLASLPWPPRACLLHTCAHTHGHGPARPGSHPTRPAVAYAQH